MVVGPAPDPAQAARWSTLALPILFERGGIDADKLALVCGEKTRTYGEMRERMRRVAHVLEQLGIVAGDRVAIFAANRIEYLEVEAGIAAACAIMVPISWRLKPMEVATILRRSGARAIFVEAGNARVVVNLCRAGEVACLETVIDLDGDTVLGGAGYETLLAAAPDTPVLRTLRLEDPHEIIFTSGTTGQPKGVVWTNGGLLFNSIQQIIDYSIGPTSSTYAIIDLHYIGGRHDFTWPVLHAGGTVHIKPSGGFDAQAAVRYVCDNGITHVLWVPTMLYEILRVPDLALYDTRALQMIMCGGAPLSVETVEAMIARFPHTNFVQVYGLTEGGGSVTCMPGHMARMKPASAGRPSVHVVLRIVDDQGCDRPTGGDGEIWVRAPSMSAGYWDDPALTEATFGGNWLRTGDVGHLDAQGYLYVTGRKKDIIISGGMNIYPSEIEDVLRTHPAVADVSVIGVPHPKWGEQVCAVVEIVAGHAPSLADLVYFCGERLAGFKKPSRVEIVDAMPRTSSGKPQKFALREMFAHSGTG